MGKNNIKANEKFEMVQIFDHLNQKTIFRFFLNNQIFEKTVTEAFADPLLIKNLKPEDALIIGFVLANEQKVQEKKYLKDYRKFLLKQEKVVR